MTELSRVVSDVARRMRALADTLRERDQSELASQTEDLADELAKATFESLRDTKDLEQMNAARREPQVVEAIERARSRSDSKT